ncbi:MAG: fused MFS/spermidine synthase [Ignavibacteriales bacterium]|nr:fused MFS/spermidine synthase [Ignavibacteriales bacterium]
MDSHNSTLNNYTQTSTPKYLIYIGFVIVVCTALFALASLFNSSLSIKTGAYSADRYQVVDRDDGRYLFINGQAKQLIDLSDMKSYTRYTAVMELPMHMFVNPGKIMLCGLGVGSLAREYNSKGWSVDIFETDTALTNLVQNYFSFNQSILPVYHQHAREYMNDSIEPYNIIMIDGISSAEYSVKSMTKEFFALASSKLTTDGIFAIAFESEGWYDEIVTSVSTTLKQNFKEVYVYPISEPPNVFGSIVLMASNTPHNDLIRDLERNDDLNPFWRYGPGYQKVHAWDNRFITDEKNGVILTDEKPPSLLIIDRLKQSSWKVPKDYLP